MYEILITMNSQRCWIVNIRAKILIVKRFFMKSAKYCNSWLAIHGYWCTAYWTGSMYRYQCCHYSVFFNMVFFCTLHFCLDVIISQNYYVIKFRIYHLLCVLLWWWWNCNFFFILTFLVFHILYIRWELIKKKEKKRK